MTNMDQWNQSNPYEYFMGRWSRKMAPVFLEWLRCERNLSWLDAGCGTGALSESIYLNCSPSRLFAVDLSAAFINKAKENVPEIVKFIEASVTDLPLPDSIVDVAVSGLALNFFPDHHKSISELKRVVKPNGIIGAYVWDYSGKMEFLRIFWDSVREVDEDELKYDEAIRFPVCSKGNLRTLFEQEGLQNISTTDLDINTVFKDFNDLWKPFLGGQGPAPSYLISLDKETVNKIKNRMVEKVHFESDGTIRLIARAVAIKGKTNTK